MPTTHPKPVPTLITEDVTATLSQVREEQGYHVNLKVERLNETNHEFNNPEHLKAIVNPGDPQRQENPSEGQDEYVRTYLIHVWLIPSQTDGMPIDELWDAVISDVVLSLCGDVGGDAMGQSFRRSGLAIDTWADDPVTEERRVQNSLAYLIHVPINVRYAHRQRNPYQQD